MKALIMAAGYGTRLYPITKDTPKPLLEVGDRPMVDHIVEKITELDEIDELILVSNDKFYERFNEWAANRDHPWPTTVLNDGTTEDGDRRGAVGDMKFSIDEAGVDDDLLVLAGDNLFDFSLTGMVETFRETQSNVVGVVRFDDESKLSKYGIVGTDETGQVVDFQEKPDEPPSNLVAIGMYVFPSGKLHLFDRYLESGGNPDEPGWYITWLVENDSVYAHSFDGNWFDIGDKDSLDRANRYMEDHTLT